MKAQSLGELIGEDVIDYEIRERTHLVFPADELRMMYYEPCRPRTLLRGSALDDRIREMHREAGYFPIFVQASSHPLELVHPVRLLQNKFFKIEIAMIGSDENIRVRIRRWLPLPFGLAGFLTARIVTLPQLYRMRAGRDGTARIRRAVGAPYPR